MANQVFIVGHKNPDNDSIAAAVSYAYLKNALEAKKAEPEAEYVSCCLGPLPQESATILEQVGLPAPKLIEKVGEGDKVILVDHNESTQMVDGIADAEIVEVVDHHRIAGDVVTGNPILYLNIPVGSTATIVTKLYEQLGVEVTPAIATVLLSAIMTDTVITKSPPALITTWFRRKSLAPSLARSLPNSVLRYLRCAAATTIFPLKSCARTTPRNSRRATTYTWSPSTKR